MSDQESPMVFKVGWATKGILIVDPLARSFAGGIVVRALPGEWVAVGGGGVWDDLDADVEMICSARDSHRTAGRWILHDSEIVVDSGVAVVFGSPRAKEMPDWYQDKFLEAVGLGRKQKVGARPGFASCLVSGGGGAYRVYLRASRGGECDGVALVSDKHSGQPLPEEMYE